MGKNAGASKDVKGTEPTVSWKQVNEFLLKCGSCHKPYAFCVCVLDTIGSYVSFDEGLFLMLDNNRRIQRKYTKNIARHWLNLYMEYYSRTLQGDFSLTKDLSENKSEPFVKLIKWEDYSNQSEFMEDYIRPRGLHESLVFNFFDLAGAPATGFSLDRTRKTSFSAHDIAFVKAVAPHLNNLYKNMFVRPNNQLYLWDKSTIEALTPREREVVELLCQGVTSSNIARRLRISEGTANKHIAHIYRKYGVNSKHELLVRLLGR